MESEIKKETQGQTMPCIKESPRTDADIIPQMPKSGFAELLAACRCERCALATPALIPDPEVVWETGMRAKPKIDGYRCHLQKPSQGGLPAVTADGWCAYFTDHDGVQPLRYLVSEHLISERSAER